MKKKIMMIVLALMLVLSGCAKQSDSTKTYSTKEEVQQVSEAFYSQLYEADSFKMESYYDDTLSSVYQKDGDRMYINYPDAYDYYLLMEDGVKYVITDDRTLLEDEYTYDFGAETIDMLLQMNILGYLGLDDDSISYSAVATGDEQLVTTVTTEYEGSQFETNITGKKTEGKITEITAEVKYGESTSLSKYIFTYDQHIELPEYTVNKTYNNMPHVESPFKTFGEIIERLSEDDYLFYTFMDDQLIVMSDKDGRYYQFSSTVSDELMDTYDSLDFMAEDYDSQLYALLSDVEIEDCIDYTDELIPQDELDSYVSKTLSTMLADGFEVDGYSIWEDDCQLYVEKDYMTYRIEAEIPEGFDSEADLDYESFDDFIIRSVVFDSPQYSALPMR